MVCLLSVVALGNSSSLFAAIKEWVSTECSLPSLSFTTVVFAPSPLNFSSIGSPAFSPSM